MNGNDAFTGDERNFGILSGRGILLTQPTTSVKRTSVSDDAAVHCARLAFLGGDWLPTHVTDGLCISPESKIFRMPNTVISFIEWGFSSSWIRLTTRVGKVIRWGIRSGRSTITTRKTEQLLAYHAIACHRPQLTRIETSGRQSPTLT